MQKSSLAPMEESGLTSLKAPVISGAVIVRYIQSVSGELDPLQYGILAARGGVLSNVHACSRLNSGSISSIHLLRYVQTTSESHAITQRAKRASARPLHEEQTISHKVRFRKGGSSGTHSTRYQPSVSGERGVRVISSSRHHSGRASQGVRVANQGSPASQTVWLNEISR